MNYAMMEIKYQMMDVLLYVKQKIIEIVQLKIIFHNVNANREFTINLDYVYNNVVMSFGQTQPLTNVNNVIKAVQDVQDHHHKIVNHVIKVFIPILKNAINVDQNVKPVLCLNVIRVIKVIFYKEEYVNLIAI